MQSGLVELPRALRLRAAASVAVGIFSLGLSATDAAAATLFVAPGGRDSGNCQTKSRPCKTIGHALSQAAASGDTIELAAGIYKENPLVSKSVSLVGAGQSATVLDGGRVASTIQTTRGRITISNLTIEHGKAALGGGIHSTAPSLTLDKVTVMQNTAAGATTPEGGGIYASAGNLTLNGSTITANTAMGAHGAKASGPGNPGGNGGAAYGGGIFMTGGNLTLHRAMVSGNRAVGGAGAAGGSIKIGTGGSGGGGGAALGGGIYIENSAFKLTLSHSVISANLAQSGPGGSGGVSAQGAGGQGGSPLFGSLFLSAAGGGVWDSASGLSASASTITGNRALDGLTGHGGGGTTSGGAGGSVQAECAVAGGGIAVGNFFNGSTFDPSVLIARSTISANVTQACTGGDGGPGSKGGSGEGGGSGGNGAPGGPARGGGLYVLGTLSVIASSVSSNSVVAGGGGRGGAGGAGGPATVSQSIAPPGGSGGNGNVGGTAFGGGIYVSGAPTLTGTTVSGNTAAGAANGDGANGGGGGSTGTKGATGGQGGNGGSGGGTVGNVPGAEGGGLYGPGNIGNSTFAANSAIAGRGGDAGAGGDGGAGPAGPGSKGASGVGGDGEDAMGGGMLWLGESTWSLVNDTIDGNQVTGGTFGSGTPTGVAGSGSGGGGWMQGGTLANSIVAGDKAFSGAAREDTSPDCGGELTTGGQNVIGAIDGCRGIVAGTNGDEGGTFTAPLDPKLALLGSYGGPTLTMAEKPGSPAIRHGSAATCESTAIGDKDQRGYPRLSARRGACDTGAYDSAEPEKLAVGSPSSATHGIHFSVTVTAVDPFAHIVTSFRDTVRFTSTDKTAKLPKNYTFTSADGGSHTFSVTLGSIGKQTITVTDTAASVINGTSATIRVS